MRTGPALLILSLAGITFIGGLALLYNLLFATGEIYPPYSSLRADPLGTRILYESVDSLPDHSTHRQYRAPWEVQGTKPDAWLFLGGNVQDWKWLTRDQAHFLIEATRAGTSVVLAFSPRQPPLKEEREADQERETSGETGEESSEPFTIEDFLAGIFQEVRFSKLFGLEFVETPVQPPLDLPGVAPSSSTQSSLWRLSPQDETWHIRRKDSAGVLLAERPLGRGRLVVLADSFPLSNEALAFQRQPGFIANILGSARMIWFDEWHLGLVENPGIGTLVARYGLLPSLAALLLAGLLYAWRISVPLIPPIREEFDPTPARRQAREGILSLLQRGIAPADLPATCWQAWKTSLLTHPQAARRHAVAIREAESLLAGEKAMDPVQRFRQINQLFQNNKDLK